MFQAQVLMKRLEILVSKTENLWDDALFNAARRPLSLLVWIIGITLAWTNYRQISSLIFETTETLFTKTTNELELEFQKEYRPVATSVRLLASASISEAKTLEDRILQDIQLIPLFCHLQRPLIPTDLVRK